MPDYNRALATAQRLIKASGRPIVFEALERGQMDPARPLEVPEDLPPVTANTFGVAVPPSSLQALGMSAGSEGLFKNCESILIVAPPVGGEDLTTFDRVIDEGVTLFIKYVEKLRPGPTTVLYYVGLSVTAATE